MSNTSITKSELDKALETQTDQIAVLFQDFMQQVDERFNKIESSIDRLLQSTVL